MEKKEKCIHGIGKRIQENWVEGKYMLTISEKELEVELPSIIERKMKQYIERCFNNG